MSVPYPMWCVVCSQCGFVGTRWESPGTSASYVEYCPSCGGGRVLTQRVESKEQHDAVAAGEVTYEEVRNNEAFE